MVTDDQRATSAGLRDCLQQQNTAHESRMRLRATVLPVLEVSALSGRVSGSVATDDQRAAAAELRDCPEQQEAAHQSRMRLRAMVVPVLEVSMLFFYYGLFSCVKAGIDRGSLDVCMGESLCSVLVSE